jgi:hypothetical protein
VILEATAALAQFNDLVGRSEIQRSGQGRLQVGFKELGLLWEHPH